MRKLARAAKKRQHDLNTSIPHRRKEYSTADVHFIDSLFLPTYPVKADIPNAHFEVLELIAQGAFGNVLKVRRLEDHTIYAMKAMRKSKVLLDRAVEQCNQEALIQAAVGDHAFIVKPHWFFQNKHDVFIVMDYVPRGELFTAWKRLEHFSEALVRICIAELAIAIDYLHNAGVIYRDLKMENILIDVNGHLQLIDFGLAKWLQHGGRTRTICGTLHYIAPEILSTWPYGHSVDWWSLGIMMYALLAGHFPVHGARDHAEMAKCVATHVYDLPADQPFSWQARKCTRKLLRRNPSSRMHDLKTLQKEAFFRELNFDSLLCKETSYSLLLSAFADGHEIGSPRYHSSIMDIFLNDSLLSAKQRCVSIDDDTDWPQFTDTMSRAMSVDTFLDTPQTQLNQSLVSEPHRDPRPRGQHQHMRLRSEDLGRHRHHRSSKKALSPTVWSALQQATGQQYYSQPKISRSTGALLNSSWQQQRQHRMRPLLTSASTNVSLDAMSDDALDRSVRITTLSF
ncbi:hypothetical protein NP493_710g00023 [Ridgeia piscesae]|uniref:Protein kinase domain-containing protein n=1 Tax=Ridgeia piscesae TaxID=27915 RepID=A0AAD9NMQ5_RIDPI|nr:hypothetical protein NP493_710g00023 [Ridgeia piscesae]